jgi:hypothetical protein
MLELVCVLLAAERMPRPATSPTIRELADLVASAEVIYVDDTHVQIIAEGEVIVLGTQIVKLGVRVLESGEQGLGRSILGGQLVIRLSEQPRQPLSITSCNLGNCVESDGIHLVERDTRHLIRPARLVFDARILQDDEEVRVGTPTPAVRAAASPEPATAAVAARVLYC